MTEEQRRTIKENIISQLAGLADTIIELEALTQPISPECALGDLARFELMHDQRISEKSLEQALIRKNRLEYVLRKIDTSEYGLCTACEEEIPVQRLLILPESTLCIACASQQD